MIIFGHRGSAGTHAEHSLAGILEAVDSGAHFIEFDVRTTRDGHVILAHDGHLVGTHRKAQLIRRLTFKELNAFASEQEIPIVTLEEALRACEGKTIANVEVKDLYSVEAVSQRLSTYVNDRRRSSWDSMMISSFNPLILARLRHNHPTVPLSMLHSLNPFNFFAWQRAIGLSSVGFHRLHMNQFATEVARQSKIMTFAFTVNRSTAAMKLEQEGMDGIVTDFPRKMVEKLDTTF